MTPNGISPSKEVSVPLPHGKHFVFPAIPSDCDYVRIVDRDGGEIAYWTSDEWKECPEDVMGAICGCMVGPNGIVDNKYYFFDEDVTFPAHIAQKIVQHGGIYQAAPETA